MLQRLRIDFNPLLHLNGDKPISVFLGYFSLGKTSVREQSDRAISNCSIAAWRSVAISCEENGDQSFALETALSDLNKRCGHVAAG